MAGEQLMGQLGKLLHTGDNKSEQLQQTNGDMQTNHQVFAQPAVLNGQGTDMVNNNFTLVNDRGSNQNGSSCDFPQARHGVEYVVGKVGGTMLGLGAAIDSFGLGTALAIIGWHAGGPALVDLDRHLTCGNKSQ